MHDGTDMHGNARLAAALGVMLDGADAELDARDVAFLRRIDDGSLPLDAVRVVS